MTLNLTIKTQERRCLILKNIDMLVNMVRYILPTNNELHGVKESKYYDGRIDTEKIESCPFYCLPWKSVFGKFNAAKSNIISEI